MFMSNLYTAEVGVTLQSADMLFAANTRTHTEVQLQQVFSQTVKQPHQLFPISATLRTEHKYDNENCFSWND